MAYKLTEADRQKYNNDGYLLINQPIFTPDKFERLCRVIDESFEERKNPDGSTPQLIDCPHWSNPAMFEWLLSDEMLDLVEPVIGPDIAIFACHFLRKPPETGKRVPWHEDSAYWEGVLEPMIVASLTIGIDPQTSDNGCMRVIPGTHVNGYSEYVPVENPSEQVFNIEIQDTIDESKAVDMTIGRNEAFLHEGRIIHGSNPNTSNKPRTAFAVRYFPATTKFTGKKFTSDFRIYLARGKDRAGNNYANPEIAYAPAGVM